MSQKSLKIKFNDILKKLDFPQSFDDFKQYVLKYFPIEDSLDYKFTEEKTSKIIKTEEDYEEIKLSNINVPKIVVSLIPKEMISIKNEIESKSESLNFENEKIEKNNKEIITKEEISQINNNDNNNENNEEIKSKIHDVISSLVKEKMEKLQNEIINDIYDNIQLTESKYLEKNENEKERLEISLINQDLSSLPIHTGIKCNECNCIEIVGSRFKCLNCENYNLCSKCERESNHNIDHIFIKIYVPDSDKNIELFPKYKNEGLNYSISENNFTFERNIDNIIKVNIKNNGSLNWKKGFMFHCLNDYSELIGEAVSIKQNLEVGNDEKVEIKFGQNYNKNSLKKINKKEYISYWQMFNEKDIPFGEAIKFIIKIN